MKRFSLLFLCLTLCLAPSIAFGQKASSSRSPQGEFFKDGVSLDSPKKIMEALSGGSSKDLALDQAKIYIKVVAGGSDVTRTDDEVSLEPYAELGTASKRPKMVTFFVDHDDFPNPAQYCMSARFSVGSQGSQKAYIWLFENFLDQHHGYKLTMDVKNDILTVVEYDVNGNIIKTYEQTFYDLVADRTYFFGAFYNYDTGFFNLEIFQTKEITYDFGKSFDLPIFLSCFEDFGPPLYPADLSFSIGAEPDSKVKVWDWATYITHNVE